MGVGIKNQCLEDWSKMTPTEKGAFCSSCTKEVIDYSRLNSSEIKLALKSNFSGEICGRFEISQLSAISSEFRFWEQNQSNRTKSIFVFSIFLVFGLALFSCENQNSLKEINQAHAVAKTIFLENQQVKEVEIEESLTPSIINNGNLNLVDIITNDTIIEQYIESDSIVSIQEEETIVHEVNIGRIEFPMDKPIHMIGLVVTVNRFDEFIEDTIAQENVVEIESIAYPNPCMNSTKLRVTTSVEFESDVQLFDLNGRLLFEMQKQEFLIGVNEVFIDLTNHSSGVYLIQLVTPLENKVVKIRKL